MAGLREKFASDVTAAPKGCRVLRWLDTFDGDDRDFLVETLESATPTDQFFLWIARNGLEVIAKHSINDHRKGRCTCPEGTEGRRA